MPKAAKKLRVFVASPSDVTAERDKLATVINELNTTLAALLPTKPVVVELVRWETHAYPALGRPQALINAQLGEYDVFLGLMWRRFGSPTGMAGSGTEKEFRLALESWQHTRRPHVLFYFSTAPAAPPKVAEEIAQMEKVVSFRAEVMHLGLVWEYEGPMAFAETVRPHLVAVIGELLRPRRGSKPKDTQKQKQSAIDDVDIDNDNAMLARWLGNAVAKGTRVVITELGPEDAFIKNPQLVIGQVITIDAIKEFADGWYTGLGIMDTPFEGLENGTITLFQFKFRPA